MTNLTQWRDGRERLASLEQRLDDHESRCEERLGEIRQSAATTLAAIEGLKNRFWIIALSLLAWAMAQVWAGSQARIGRLEAAPPTAVAEVSGVPLVARHATPGLWATRITP
jgi:hypothetical protein